MPSENVPERRSGAFRLKKSPATGTYYSYILIVITDMILDFNLFYIYKLHCTNYEYIL